MSDHAIVLNKRKFGDSDLIVSLFLEGGGKRSGIAKGGIRSRKRFGNCLEIGSRIQLSFRERPPQEMLQLEEASLLEQAPLWRRSWTSIVAAEYALELAAHTLPEHKPVPEKFRWLQKYLEELQEEDWLEALVRFEFGWLSLSGWAPLLDHCGICGLSWEEGAEWQLLLDQGNIYCPRCKLDNRLTVNRQTIGYLRLIQKELSSQNAGDDGGGGGFRLLGGYHQVTETVFAFSVVKFLLDQAWMEHIGRPLRSRKILQGLL